MSNTEQKLKESEEKYRLLFEESPVAIMIMEMDGKIMDCNPVGEKSLGYTKEELVGKDFRDFSFFPDIHGHSIMQAFKSLLKGNAPEPFRVEIIKKDGSVAWVLIRTSLVKSSERTLIQIIAEDITKSKKLEQNLEASENLEQKLTLHSRKTEILNKIILMANTAENFNSMIQKIFDLTLELMDFDGGGVYIADYDKNIANLIYFKNLPQDFVDAVKECPLDADPYKSLFHESESIFSENWQLNDPVFAEKSGLLALAVIPIKSKEVVIGALNVASKKRYVFSEEEKDILEYIGHEIGIIIEKMKMEEELRTHRDDLELLIEARTMELKDSEAEIKAIYNNTPVIIILVDEERRVQKANHLALKFSRRNAEEILGLRGGEALRCLNSLDDPRGCGFGPECQFCLVRSTVLDTFKTEKAFYGIEYSLPFIIEQKRVELSLLISTIPLTIKGKNMVLVSINDISDLKLAQNALKVSEERLYAFMDAAPIAFYLYDSELNILDLNETALKWFQLGEKKEDIIGRNIAEIVPNLKQLGIYDGFINTINTGQRFFVDDIVLSPKVGGKHFSVRAFKVGEGLGSIAIDITKRIKAEQIIKESEEKFRTIVETINELIWEINKEGVFTYVSPRAEALLGMKPEELIGKTPLDLMSPDEAERIGLFLRERIESPEPFTNLESIHIHKDGREIIIATTGTPFFDQKGAFLGYRGSDWDITARNKIMEDLKRSNTELEQFAYVVSHDLQEPLRMVASFTQLLQSRYQDKLDDEANEYIDFAVDGATRMQGLINDLLTFSRIGTKGISFSPTDMNVILENVLANIQQSTIEAEAKITYDPLPVIIADGSQMMQILQNLISNAIKFRGKSSISIHVSGESLLDKWVFSVKDTGIGIDPKHFERIFFIFQRLHKRDEYEGTGIGLAVCKRIIHRHGGKIWVESAPGEGSTFYFSIPKKEVVQKTI